MIRRSLLHYLVQISLFAWLLTGCLPTSAQLPVTTTPVSQIAFITPKPTVITIPSPTMIAPTPFQISELSAYAFPGSIDPSKHYLFFLHGKIIEDQGIHAVSPEYGVYEYEAMLQNLREHGFEVISEARPKNTDVDKYAERVVGQVVQLLNARVPPKNINVVGASKGGFIVVIISNLLKNEEINFVLLSSCSPDNIKYWIQNDIFLYGNVLSIYDSADTVASSCQEFFSSSVGKGLTRHNEIVLHVGTGHGVLYKALDDWILPVVEWAK